MGTILFKRNMKKKANILPFFIFRLDINSSKGITTGFFEQISTIFAFCKIR